MADLPPDRVWRRKVLVARPGTECVAYQKADRFPYYEGDMLATKEQAGCLPLEIETEEYADETKQRAWEVCQEVGRKPSVDEFEKLWPKLKAVIDEDYQQIPKLGAD